MLAFIFVQARLHFDARRPLNFLLFSKRVIVFFHWYFIFHYILRFLFPYVFPYCTFIQPHCTYAQNFLFPYLYFKFECLSNIISKLFPFKYPMKYDTLYFGGVDTKICTWSTIKCPSIISTPLYLHNFVSIFPILLLYWLSITFHLYLGVNIIWFLHNHFVCDKLFCLFAI